MKYWNGILLNQFRKDKLNQMFVWKKEKAHKQLKIAYSHKYQEYLWMFKIISLAKTVRLWNKIGHNLQTEIKLHTGRQ